MKPTEKLTLRPASQLKAERQSKERADRDDSFRNSMNEIIKRIENAHSEGKKSVWSLSIMASVAKELRAKGYTVKDYPACGMGDMDSTEISWE